MNLSTPGRTGTIDGQERTSTNPPLSLSVVGPYIRPLARLDHIRRSHVADDVIGAAVRPCPSLGREIDERGRRLPGRRGGGLGGSRRSYKLIYGAFTGV